MKGKTVLLTGSPRGIGKETERQLAAFGASLILVGRDECRPDAAVADLRHTSGNGDVTAITADMSRLRDIRRWTRPHSRSIGSDDVLRLIVRLSLVGVSISTEILCRATPRVRSWGHSSVRNWAKRPYADSQGRREERRCSGQGKRSPQVVNARE
ncbi:SDR family NAD(P)-dependent oxidoreductase [Streptomyces sp. MMBL 11-3]|uniref:SDR family NAD(P)-dependent oxidoreductase n=1 Tax=Streptomyces sp. MMBL 11-3 TaxID=3382639 RepID=UPI0039B6DB81